MTAGPSRRRRRSSAGARLVAAAAAVLLVTPAAGCCLASRLGGAFIHGPDEAADGLSAGGKALVDAAFQGIPPGGLTDYHVHVVGLGAGGTGASVNARMTSPWHPLDHFKFHIYRSAAGIDDDARADRQYIERLVALARAMPVPPMLHAMAFDRHHRADGSADEERTEFHVPNAYVFALAAEFPDVLVPVMSVHPYRPDALAEVARWADAGGRFIKWLPNAMGIDPAAPRNDAYYDLMRSRGLVLISHAGEEQAVHAEQAQELGNPLRLRRPLDRGVRVVIAHCASLGEGLDLDAPARPGAEADERPRLPSFDLFLRLMREPRYEGLVFGEISAMLQFNRLPRPIATLLTSPDLHGRLVNGSDYPLPAINAVVRTRAVRDAGLITAKEREGLNEIYDYNPLLYDFVLKRTIRGPGGERLPARVFLGHPGLR